jgi:hypothetical protein
MNQFTYSMLLLLAVLPGCSRGAPSGFPDVYPCQVKVVKGNTPESGVSVLLYPQFDAGGLLMSGTTDSHGVAFIATTFHGYSRRGVPEGEYVAVLEKLPEVVDTMPKAEFDQLLPLQKMAHQEELANQRLKLPRIVPEKYTDVSSSPLKFRVEKPTGGNVEANLAE